MEQGARGTGLVCGAAMLVLALAGCEPFRLFNDYETAQSDDVAEAPWPRLVDVPRAPPPGQFGPGVPDPTTGAVLRAALAERARRAAERRTRLEGAVIDEASRRVLTRR